jgi:ABC-2 type transport system ATP-binding protein
MEPAVLIMASSNRCDVFPLRVDGLTKVYPSGKAAVKGLSFALERGQITGLLGPNGAGKSTTMKVLATVFRPTAGVIRFGPDAISFWDAPESVRLPFKRQIGWMPEEPLLYSWLTAREFLKFLGRLMEIPSRRLDARIAELLEIVQLGEAADQFTIRYSHGMRRKASLAAALLHEPDVLLLDEPTSGIDPEGVRDIKNVIAQLKAQGKAILVSTHILDTAEKICDRVAIMSRGELAFIGDVQALRRELHAPSSSSLEDLFIELTHTASRRPARSAAELRP